MNLASLAICVPTYQRNRELGELLSALQSQEAPDEIDVSILVIDNNPGGEAACVVEEARTEAFRYPLRYLHETAPGVTYVRNRALKACAVTDYLAFIDDDELPAPGWIAALWQRHRESGAAVVFGDVIARYEGAPPDWIVEGDFHSKRVWRDGPRDKPGATDNCLIEMAVVRRHGLRFDPALSLIGGEDTLFFDALLLAGERFADAAGAVTYERVPEGRARLDWLMRRWRRTGLTDAMMIARRRAGTGASARAGLDGLVRILAGSGLAGLAWLAGSGRMSAGVARRLYTLQRGLGMIDFACGRQVQEYSRPAGPGATG